MPVGRSVSEVLRLVQAFQFTDECGEVRREEREGQQFIFPVRSVRQVGGLETRL